MQAQALIDEYVDRWRGFYPTKAFANGDVASAAAFENFDPEVVRGWLSFNDAAGSRARALLLNDARLSDNAAVDLQVLADAATNERADWDVDRYLTAQPQWYAEQISQALTHLLVREQLTAAERSRAAVVRLRGVVDLCRIAKENLREGNALRTRRAIEVLDGTRRFYEGQLAESVDEWPDAENLQGAIADTARALASLGEFLEESLLPRARAPIALGSEIYSDKLKRRSQGSDSPEQLAESALAEISAVRGLMIDEAGRWQSTLGSAGAGLAGEALLTRALEVMENDRQENAADFLNEFREQTIAAERFVDEHSIASIPKPTTLYVALSPAYFSGAAVGGVYPSGPFAPTAKTLFFLPSIPDSAPQEAKEGFYRSFNTHFNTMIISHEMFPGHYLQYKVAVSEAPAIRSLFADDAYVEGWGSFVEELMLDEGWADNAPLTRLAHLRKRLENATRAYVSVKVHTKGWGREKVAAFAIEEGLLAPQFAENLWLRVVHSPMQITDYFRGYQRIKTLFVSRAPDRPLGEWVDTLLRAGPVPLPILERLMQAPL
ncbi:MAG: DUF885 family protein [Pseudomonadota bacterium]